MPTDDDARRGQGGADLACELQHRRRLVRVPGEADELGPESRQAPGEGARGKPGEAQVEHPDLVAGPRGRREVAELERLEALERLQPANRRESWARLDQEDSQSPLPAGGTFAA